MTSIAPAPLPSGDIEYDPAQIGSVVDMVERCLFPEGEDPIMFERGGILCRIVRLQEPTTDQVRRELGATIVAPVTRPWLREQITSRAPLVRWDRRAKAHKPIGCPTLVADTYLARSGSRQAPELVGVASSPYLDGDGEIIQTPGYSRKTALYLDPGAETFPEVPEFPLRQHIAAAKSRLAELLCEFAFEDATSHAVAVAAIATGIQRRMLPIAPGFAIDASGPAEGKTTLATVIGIIASGREPAVMAHPRDAVEEQKLIFSVAFTGDPVLLLDNIEHPLQSELLNALLTTSTMSGRPLGQTAIVRAPTSFLFLVTGNNLVIQGDLTARMLRCRLNSRVERPEHRTFERNVLDYARDYRPDIVSAVLTLLRGYWHSGVMARDVVAPWSRFPAWSDTIRAPLVWAGYPDPVASLDRLRAEDPERVAHAAMLQAWRMEFDDEPTTVKEIVERCRSVLHERLRDAAMTIAGERGEINATRLGRWIARHDSRIQDGMVIRRVGVRSGTVAWRVEAAA